MNELKTYITIQSWMIIDLKLEGNELILYAIIFGFSQDGRGEFRGSLSYIEKMLNISKPTIIEILESLIQKGFLIRTNENGYKSVSETKLLRGKK